MGLIDKIVPKYQVKAKSSHWLDGEVLHTTHMKNTAWKKAKKSNKKADWNNFKMINNRFKCLIRNKYNNFVNEAFVGLSSDSKKIWKIASVKGGKSSLQNEIKLNQDIVSSSLGKA